MRVAVVLFLLAAIALICSCEEHHDSGEHSSEEKHKHEGEKSGAVANAHAKKGKKYSAHKHAKKTGKKSQYDEEHSAKGQHGSIVHKVDDEEESGKKSSYFDKGGHKGYKKAAHHAAHKGFFDEGKNRKKTRYSKGFREKYHKDEHKKHDSFYSRGFKSGDFEVFASKGARFNKLERAKDDHDEHTSKKGGNKHGKSGKKAQGHNKSERKGHSDEKGVRTHHEKSHKWAKKGPKSSRGKKFVVHEYENHPHRRH